MTDTPQRLQLSATILAGFCANPNRVLDYDSLALRSLSLADKLIEAERASRPTEKRETVKTETATPDADDALIIPLLLNTPEFLAPWAQWQAIRRKGKKPKTGWSYYFTNLLQWLETFGLEGAIESVSASARNQYTGLFPPKGFRNARAHDDKPAPDFASVELGARQRGAF